MKALRLKSLAVLCLTTLPWAAGATDMTFEQGSLIIPMQRAYQDECGAVSAYGLVYRLLQNNITVYWTVNPNKNSHHRCKNTVFTTNGGTTSNPTTPTTAELKAMDGCDMSVASDSGFPVALLNNAKAVNTESSTFSTYDTSSFAPNNTGEAAITVDKNRKYLRYMGGPFVIDASQAERARDLIQNNLDFANFRGTADCYANSKVNLGSAFHVNVHVAKNAFKAPIARVMNETPPPIALVKGNAVAILVGYLKNAGLQSDANQGTFEKHGLIFDVLDENTDMSTSAAYPYGKLNWAPDPANPRKTYYQVMWAPHWEGDTKDHSSELTTTLANIAHFADIGNSIFNECASIQTYEDGYSPYDNSTRFKFAANTPTRFFTGRNSLGTANANNGVLTTQGELADMNGKAGFAPSGQDCSDTNTGDCYMYGNYADLFTQKGDYKLIVSSGLVESYKPRVGQAYESGTSRMFYTRSRDVNTALADGWDIFITRQKDNNRQKGKILYLGGHSFNSSAAGSRLVLNTLLNLAFRPDAVETSRSEPVADVIYSRDEKGRVMHDDSDKAMVQSTRVLSGTFMSLEPQPLFPERNTFMADKAADWMFPYVQGRFRSLDPTKIGITTQAYKVGQDWEADALLPLPKERTVFTALGDNQSGLVKVKFVMDEVTPGKCRDDNSTGQFKTVCDLEEALNLDGQPSTGLRPLTKNPGDDVLDPLLSVTDRNRNTLWNKHFVQRVLGYCVSYDEATKTSKFTPDITDCDNLEFGEVRAHLGGLDHASAAVVGYSSYIKPATTSTPARPEMAYIGGRDGQLHAIFLRGSVPGRTTQPTAGTELWSFVPQGQLSRLSTNNARVDLSPVVSDVFVDYDVTGNQGTIAKEKRHTNKFVWRTVLVSGSGQLGGELFALDVTDPVNPIVLWDVVGGPFTPEFGKDVTTAISWTDSVTVPNKLGDYANVKINSYTYDYSNLGDALSMNLVPVRRGNRPTFQLIVATNGALTGNRQLNVFAIDAGSGEKIWEWKRLYGLGPSTTQGPDVSNSAPGGTSTFDVDGDGNMDRVYVGDMEGKLWELSVLTGANLNYFPLTSSGPYVSYPLYDNTSHTKFDPTVGVQPITTVPAIMRLPYSLKDTTSFAGMNRLDAGRLALVFGTGGVDWAAATKPAGKYQGQVFVAASLPEDLVVRSKVTYDSLPIDSGVLPSLKTIGAVKSDAVIFTKLLENERIVGAPKILGSTILTTTAYGNVDKDYLKDLHGRTHLIDMSKSGADIHSYLNDNSNKSAAGVVVLPDGSVVTQGMGGIQKTEPGKVVLPKMGLPGKRTSVRVGSWLDTGNAYSE